VGHREIEGTFDAVGWTGGPATSAVGLVEAEPHVPDWQRDEPDALADPGELAGRLRAATSLIEELRPLAELGELVAFVAHELRNPLAGIAATAEVLLDACEPSDEAAEGLAVILREAERLERTVGNLLNLARFRRLRLLAIDVAREVDGVARAIAAEAQRAGVAVRVERADLATPVLVDPDLIQHAFANLAINAVQATAPGGTVTIRALVPDADSDFVCVEFADTGCGIAPADLRRIFDPFFTTRADGVGLGLAAARKLLEHQGAHVTVESEPGRGTRFTVYLRRADSALGRS